MMTDPIEINDEHNSYNYSYEEVKITSQKHLAYFNIPSGEKDINLIKYIYSQFSPLNEDWLDFRRELDVTNDKSIILNNFTNDYLPIYTGETIWHFNANFKNPKQFFSPIEYDNYLFNKNIKRVLKDCKTSNLNDEKSILNFIKCSKDDLQQFIIPERNLFRLAFRKIARDTNERTLISALLPKNIATRDPLYVSIPGKYILNYETKSIDFIAISLSRLLFAQAIFNSILVDWVLRASVAINANKTYVVRLPIPQPSDDDLANNDKLIKIVKISAMLSLCNTPILLDELAKLYKISDNEIFVLNESEQNSAKELYDITRIELDLEIAKLYNLSAIDMSHIIDNFAVMYNKKPAYMAMLRDKIEEL
jgi:hypothetical protein